MSYLVSSAIAIIIIFASCKTDKNKPSYREMQEIEKELVDVNKALVQKDRAKIKAFVKRRGWDMNETESGLWYQIYDKGRGEKATTGKTISLKYTVSLLDGTLCYSSDSTGIKQFTIGKGGVESGLERGVRMLQEGDKARFIMPPHLAHGLVGDDGCIPARSVIVYDIEVLNISN